MKEPKVFCECNSTTGRQSGIGGINPYQLTLSDLQDKSLFKTCPVCHLYPWHDAYYENEQFDKEKQTMTEYITEPIDYTGCDPVIAEHLKRGQRILCWADKGEKVWVIAFDSGCDGQLVYRVAPFDDSERFGWASNPVPIPRPKKIKMIMPPERALPILFAAGYSFRADGGLATNSWDGLYTANFQHFGKPLDQAPGWFHSHPEIIEEVDE